MERLVWVLDASLRAAPHTSAVALAEGGGFRGKHRRCCHTQQPPLPSWKSYLTKTYTFSPNATPAHTRALFLVEERQRAELVRDWTAAVGAVEREAAGVAAAAQADIVGRMAADAGSRCLFHFLLPFGLWIQL